MRTPRRTPTLTLLGGLLLFGAVSVSAPAQADRIHLVSGAVLEGKASHRGHKVVIALPSGELALEEDDVERIEPSPSSIDDFETRHAALRPHDVAARLELADYCRDHDMAGREQQLLLEVLELDKDNAQARARLGYVKTANGWVPGSKAEDKAAKVFKDGRWLDADEAMKQLRSEAELLKLQRDTAQAELSRSQIEADRAERDRRAAQRNEQLHAEERERSQPDYAGYAGSYDSTGAVVPVMPYAYGAPYGYVVPYGYGYGYGNGRGVREPDCRGGRCAPRKPASASKPFVIPGVRDPRDATWSVPGVRDPREDL